jgi:Fe-S cluster assembly protein SufD
MSDIMTSDTVSGDVDRFVAAFELSDGTRLNGRSEHLRVLRRRAIDSFQRLGWPGPKQEAWKYTPIAKAISEGFTIDLTESSAAPAAVEIDRLRIPGLAGPLVVLVDGDYSESLSDTVNLVPGITVSSLGAAIREFPELVDGHLGAYCNIDTEPFEALNTAFVRDGVFVHVENNVDAITPVQILSLTTGRNRRFSQPRVLCLVGENSRATIVEHQRSLAPGAAFTNLVCEIRAGRHAVVDHYRIQFEDDEASQVCSTKIYQEEASEVSTFTASLGGGLVRNNLHILPDGEHCVSHLNGLFIGTGTRHIDNHTLVDHAKPNCQSNELYKGVLSDKSTGVFNGKVFVRRDAQKTNAYQSNKSIVLSPTARMFAKPELEIYADDVKCSHGATTGQLDSEALFYLQSRGIPADRARTILLQAFASDVLKLIRIESVRTYVEDLVHSRIHVGNS